MKVSRRQFLRTSAAATAAAGVPLVCRTATAHSSSDIRLAVIGVNGRGKAHIRGFGSHVVALCDVDQQVLAERAKSVGHPVDTFTDYRRLLDRNDINAVSIATPNHSHAVIGIAAIQAGKDVYVEKPVSHNVWEGRQLVNAARKYHRIVQCGTQSRSNLGVAEAAAFVRDEKLGPIEYAIGTCYKPRPSIGKLDKPLKIPEWIDYELWCGPADKVDLYRPRLHYDWHWDFNTGSGDMGNQGIHEMDIARWFLGELALSPRVMSIGGRLGYADAGDTANTQVVYHDFEKAPLIFETRGLPRSKAAQKAWTRSMDTYRGSPIGVIVQCRDGYVVVPSYASIAAFDNDGHQVAQWKSRGDHFQNFLKAVESQKTSDLNGDILEGHLSSALCHTGNISHRIGHKESAREIAEQVRSNPRLSDSFDRMAKHLDANEVDIDHSTITLGPWLEMDPMAERFTNSDAANELLTREYRRPFVVPDLS